MHAISGRFDDSGLGLGRDQVVSKDLEARGGGGGLPFRLRISRIERARHAQGGSIWDYASGVQRRVMLTGEVRFCFHPETRVTMCYRALQQFECLQAGSKKSKRVRPQRDDEDDERV